MRPLILNGIYRHYKGNYYKVLNLAKHSESLEDMVVYQAQYGENCVYRIYKGCDDKYDDRGDLFVALRNVAVNMFPNVSFRSAGYIYNR